MHHDSLIDRSAAELQSIHRQSIGRIRQALSNRNAQFNAVLTPEQQTRFEQIERERQESWRATNSWRGHPRGHGHGDGPRDRHDPDRPRATNSPAATNVTEAAPEQPPVRRP